MKDHDNLDAFVLNDESEGPDNEFSPENLDIDLKRFNNIEND